MTNEPATRAAAGRPAVTDQAIYRVAGRTPLPPGGFSAASARFHAQLAGSTGSGPPPGRQQTSDGEATQALLEGVMAHDSSQLLGVRQLAGASVNPRGHGWQQGTRQIGLVGEAIGYAATQRAKGHTSATPEFPRIAFLAVTDREVALIKIGSGGLNGKLEEVLARVPRSEVASAEVSRGALRTNLTIGFTDGGRWEFEVSPLIRRTVVQVVHALGY